MTPPRRILFVCTGNICRSAMAEHLLRHRAAERGLPLEARSAGTAAESWYEVPAHARKLLAAAGVPPFEHKARLVTRDELRWADLVLVMTDGHREHLSEKFPEFETKVRLFLEQGGFGEKDVADPMGGSEAVFAACLAEIDRTLEALLRSGFADPD